MSTIQILTETEAYESYDEMLDECYPLVQIGSSTFLASSVLREMNPTCYEIGFSEYCDNAAENGHFRVEGYTDDEDVGEE
jgi:hypothetical protein